MKVLIFGKSFNENFDTIILNLLERLFAQKIEIGIFKPFHDFLFNKKKFQFDFNYSFSTPEEVSEDTDFMISIGGDGTMLEAITYIQRKGIPLVGINSGRLGFLANISGPEVMHAIEHLLAGDYQIEQRSVLQLDSKQALFKEFPYAFNECTILKTGSSLITIHVSIDGEYLTSYWADGLIISTPTGSTAYSLSVGGPIISPQSQVFTISPIAAHNLNVRPLVIPDTSSLSLTIEGRTDSYLVTLDSRSTNCEIGNEILISKADFPVKMIKLHSIAFYSTLRNKLMWGEDKRN